MYIRRKTEVRFRQQTVIHDFVRESIRAALMKARPVPQFLTEIGAQPSASAGLTSPGSGNQFADASGASDGSQRAPWRDLYEASAAGGFALQAPAIPATTARLEFEGGIAVEANAAVSLARAPQAVASQHPIARSANSRSRLRPADRARAANGAYS
jgi:DNA mismatch repair protein MutL